jgi:hypothetical protein
LYSLFYFKGKKDSIMPKCERIGRVVEDDQTAETRGLVARSFGWWLMLICSERKVLLADCWWVVCSEKKVLLTGG